CSAWCGGGSVTQHQLAVTGERPLNIGMVCPYSFDEPGGVQIHAIELCAELQRRGHHVSLIGPGEQREGLPEFLECGGPSFRIRYNGSVARLSFGPRTRRHLRRWIARNDFDVVHIHEPNSPSYSMLTLAVAEGPMVATYHASASGSKLLKLALPALNRWPRRDRWPPWGLRQPRGSAWNRTESSVRGCARRRNHFARSSGEGAGVFEARSSAVPRNRCSGCGSWGHRTPGTPAAPPSALPVR